MPKAIRLHVATVVTRNDFGKRKRSTHYVRDPKTFRKRARSWPGFVQVTVHKRQIDYYPDRPVSRRVSIVHGMRSASGRTRGMSKGTRGRKQNNP